MGKWLLICSHELEMEPQAAQSRSSRNLFRRRRLQSPQSLFSGFVRSTFWYMNAHAHGLSMQGLPERAVVSSFYTAEAEQQDCET
jgi:hypothetical protein